MLRPGAQLAAVLLSLAGVGCHADRRYESVCQVMRKEVVETDDNGAVTQVDIELEWDPCPGDQVQVVRGGSVFATCIEKYRPGDLVPVKVVHRWDTRGFWDWDLYEVGDCPRPIEVGSFGSYAKSRECAESTAHGRADGFDCALLPERRLAKICPWMKRD